MTQVDAHLSTGLSGLDGMIRGLIPGDNLVWQVDSVDDYLPLVEPYCQSAARQGQRLVYMRFASHNPLLAANSNAQVVQLNPSGGFESFITDVHKAIRANGRGGYYLFDSLSGLADDWHSDQMLGNFFMLTCPYLFDMEAIAYFALQRNRHSHHALGPIGETAQVVINIYRQKDRLYLHPQKVQQRHSSTMYMLHKWDGNNVEPVLSSATTSEILGSLCWSRRQLPAESLGAWDRLFSKAGETLDALRLGLAAPAGSQNLLDRLLRMCISRDDRILRLASKHLALADMVDIGKRIIGTGLIGGKSAGMLIGNAVLRHDNPKWDSLLEKHDSFFVGSDVFCTYLVRNGVWWIREQQRDEKSFLDGADRGRQRILMGAFAPDILEQFEQMLDYFGQSPIIVRSSSLLEDNFGNAFAGKYESVFCANQGSRAKRLEDFLSAVRTIYASAMSHKALLYRAQRGMLQSDEQMALLIQRVSGSHYGRLFLPQIAGVGFSFNPYCWSEYIDPRAGMIRLVFGLGTRAVNRSDDDYTRVAALNDPSRRPETNFDKVRRYSQKNVDVLDLEANQLVSAPFEQVSAQAGKRVPADLLVSHDGEGGGSGALTFDGLFERTDFVTRMREMLSALQSAYNSPVDTEFTCNFDEDGRYKINLLQCRPLQVKESGPTAPPPVDVNDSQVLLRAGGAVIGRGRLINIGRLIYVSPSAYWRLPMNDRYALARLIGQIVHAAGRDKPDVLLIGPGRWGTTTPSLGVPVSYADIDKVCAICEVVSMNGQLVPDVSLGTHFLNELVEMDVLYMALFPLKEGNFLNEEMLENAPDRFKSLCTDSNPFPAVLRVIDARDLGAAVILNANTLEQTVVCHIA
jgi:pyruvate,water dikinase